jgi:hypothetical protein
LKNIKARNNMGGSMDFTSTYKVTKVSEQDDQQQGKLSVGDYVVINESCATYYGQLINILPETEDDYERYIVQQIHLNTVRETTTSLYNENDDICRITEEQFMDMCAHYLNDQIEESKENIANERAKLKKLTAYLRRTKNKQV